MTGIFFFVFFLLKKLHLSAACLIRDRLQYSLFFDFSVILKRQVFFIVVLSDRVAYRVCYLQRPKIILCLCNLSPLMSTRLFNVKTLLKNRLNLLSMFLLQPSTSIHIHLSSHQNWNFFLAGNDNPSDTRIHHEREKSR